MKLTWETAEQDLRDALGLDSTPGSGNQWHAPGDAVDQRHYLDSPNAFMADTKSTKNKGYRVTEKFLLEWSEKAMEAGKVFLLHLQFQDHAEHHKTDWVLCSLDDFVELTVNRSKTDRQKKAIAELRRLLSTFKDADVRERYAQILDWAVDG